MATIELNHLTKRFGDVLAVDDLSFTLEAGTITGFLGPNGAGKSTTMRMQLGLVRPTSGSATIDGRPSEELIEPWRVVGALIDPAVFHPGRRARDELLVRATAAGLPTRAVDRALDQVDLAGVARRRVGGFSMGMRQRLALGAALLGDPQVLILDEPANGLDPEGVHWLRRFIRDFGADGRTVMVSSHLLSEVAQTVDDIVVIARGRLVRQAPLATFTSQAHGGGVKVRTPTIDALLAALQEEKLTVRVDDSEQLVVLDATPEQVGRVVSRAGIVVYEMSMVQANLEDAFLELTTDHEGTRS